MKLTNDGHIYLPNENGNFISENQRRTAEILQDYDPNLQLQWIPPGDRGVNDYAFRVVDTHPNRNNYVVCFANECDERLLAKVFQADQQRNGHDVLSYLDNHNAAIELLKASKAEEQRMEDHELAYSILRSTKIHYKHNGIDFGSLR
jgi:hypothetical protein